MLEEQAKIIEEVADKAELEESQRCKPDADTLTNPSHPLHSSDSLSCKKFCEPSKDEASKDEENSSKSLHLTPTSVCSKGEPSKDEASEDVEENSSKSFHQTPSYVCSKTSKGHRIRLKEERRERNRQKKWERKEQAAATRLFMIPIERIIGGAEKEEPPVPQTREVAALEDNETIRNKKARRERKRQRRAERKETSSQVLMMSDQNISEERSTAQKEPLKPISRENIPTWIDGSYPDDSYFQNAKGEIFIVCDDSDESSEDSDESSEDSDSYYQNAFWEEYHSEDELSSSKEDEKPGVVLQPIQPDIKATPAENDCQEPPNLFGPPSSIVERATTPKESPIQDRCHLGEAEWLYDEWATEETMQLLSGELGGPNLLQNLFGRTREGALMGKYMVRSKGGACDDDPNICKVCKRSFQRLLKHLASSADCAQEYDLQKMHEENKAKSAAKGVESKRNKRKAERAEDEPAFKAKAAAQRTNHRQVERAENEPAFKAKAAAQKKINDNALRAKDEEGFRSKVAAKKTNQRDVSRAQNEEEFKAKRAVEKQHEREALRAQNEEEFKAKRAAQEKKRQDSLREKDEPRLKQEAAVKKKNQREVLRTENEAKLRGKWAAEKKISEIGR